MSRTFLNCTKVIKWHSQNCDGPINIHVLPSLVHDSWRLNQEGQRLKVVKTVLLHLSKSNISLKVFIIMHFVSNLLSIMISHASKSK